MKELQYVRNILTISNFTRYKMINDLGIHGNKIRIIPNCIDHNELEYKPLKRVSPFTLLTVARLDANERYKGHDLVIKALALLKAKDLNIIYNIIGDGTDRVRLEQLAKDLMVDKQVNFLGKVSFDEIKDAYHDCHLFIMPSYYSIRPDGYPTGEGFGIVYLEAGASGRAVIGCDVGGQTDYIRDGINGLLVKPDEADIAKKIEYLYGKWDLLEVMGRNGRKIVEKEFSMNRFEKDLKKFLEEIEI
jgi:glycosyltransferase involved in cell wall biosynthesis